MFQIYCKYTLFDYIVIYIRCTILSMPLLHTYLRKNWIKKLYSANTFTFILYKNWKKNSARILEWRSSKMYFFQNVRKLFFSLNSYLKKKNTSLIINWFTLIRLILFFKLRKICAHKWHFLRTLFYFFLNARFRFIRKSIYAQKFKM